MKYFKLIEELDIDGDKNPDGFLINLCTLDKNNNIIYLKSKYMTFNKYIKNKKWGSDNNNNIIIHRSIIIKNPDIIFILTKNNPTRTIIIVDDDKDKEPEKKLNLPENKELTPAELRNIAKTTIASDKNNSLLPDIKKQLIFIANTKDDKDLIIKELERKIDTIDRNNQDQKINDIKQMQMIQHMQLMNISNQINDNNNNNNSYFGNFASSLVTGFGIGLGSGLASLLIHSFISHPYYSYDYGFSADHYYPNYYENTTIIEKNYFINNEVNIDNEVDIDNEIEVDNDYDNEGFGDMEF